MYRHIGIVFNLFMNMRKMGGFSILSNKSNQELKI